MATAVRKVETKKVLDAAEEEQIVLRMSREEADFLYSLTAHIGGPPEGYRGIADSFRDALYGAGVNASWIRYIRPGGSISCKDRRA